MRGAEPIRSPKTSDGGGDGPGSVVGLDPAPIDLATARLRRTAALATAGMMLLSWPLWAGGEDFPRVPFARMLHGPPVAADLAMALVLLSGLVATGLARRWKPWYAVSVVALAWLVLNDQHRFQPWAYQYVMTVLFLSALPRGEGLRYARWWFVALYAHSGLSKLDVSFCNELGPLFLRAALGPFGVDPARWAGAWRNAAVLAMPIGELAVAAALAFPKSRRLGRWGAVGLHAGLIGILSPFGLRHSTIVLVWNAAVLTEVWIAFGPDLAHERNPSVSWWRVPVRLVFWAGVILPLGERWGVFDVWPSHALYASHVERVVVSLHESELSEWPPEIRRHVLEGQGGGPWRVLDLTGWSREVRGTPVYPQNRAGLGLAEALAARYVGRFVRVVAYGPADRWTGRRRRVEAVTLGAIRALGDTFLLNAHPARSHRVPEPLGSNVSTPNG